MLRRAPTRLGIEQVDIEELDRIRKQMHANVKAAGGEKDDLTTPKGGRDGKEKPQQELTTRERIGLPGKPSSNRNGRPIRLPHWSIRNVVDDCQNMRRTLLHIVFHDFCDIIFPLPNDFVLF